MTLKLNASVLSMAALALSFGLGCASSEDSSPQDGGTDLVFPQVDGPSGERRADAADGSGGGDRPNDGGRDVVSTERPGDVPGDGAGQPHWLAATIQANGTALQFTVNGRPPAADLTTRLTNLPLRFNTQIQIATNPATATMTANNVEVTVRITRPAEGATPARTVSATMQAITVAAVGGDVTITRGTQLTFTDTAAPSVVREVRVNDVEFITVNSGGDTVIADLGVLQDAMPTERLFGADNPPLLHAGGTYQFEIVTRNIELALAPGGPLVSNFRGSFTLAQ